MKFGAGPSVTQKGDRRAEKWVHVNGSYSETEVVCRASKFGKWRSLPVPDLKDRMTEVRVSGSALPW